MKITIDIDFENSTITTDETLVQLLGSGAVRTLATRLAIIAALQKSPEASNATIAKRVGTSAMTVNRLVRDLGGEKHALEGGLVTTSNRGTWSIPSKNNTVTIPIATRMSHIP